MTSWAAASSRSERDRTTEDQWPATEALGAGLSTGSTGGRGDGGNVASEALPSVQVVAGVGK
jgi:hypothetical protein